MGRSDACSRRFLQFGTDHLPQGVVEPRPLALQHQPPAPEHRRSRLGKAKEQRAKSAGVRLPERQDDLLALRAGPFDRRIEHLDAIADYIYALRTDQHHLRWVFRAEHRLNSRGHQRLCFVDPCGAGDMVSGGIRQPLASEEGDDLGRLSVLEAERTGRQRWAAWRIRVRKDSDCALEQERQRERNQETRKAPDANISSGASYSVKA